jgi:hypothetical protein
VPLRSPRLRQQQVGWGEQSLIVCSGSAPELFDLLGGLSAKSPVPQWEQALPLPMPMTAATDLRSLSMQDYYR